MAVFGRREIDYSRTENGVTTSGRVTDETSLSELLEWARAHEKEKDR